MRVLIIDNNVKLNAKLLIEHASANPLTMDDIVKTLDGLKEPVGNDPKFTLMIDDGYKVVYSIEEQSKGKVKHMSISVNEPKKLPSPDAVEEIMKLLEFKDPIESAFLDIEEIDNDLSAITVYEIV